MLGFYWVACAVSAQNWRAKGPRGSARAPTADDAREWDAGCAHWQLKVFRDDGHSDGPSSSSSSPAASASLSSGQHHPHPSSMQQSHRAAPVAFLAAPPSPSSASEAAPRPSPARRVPSPSSRRMPSYTGMLALLLAVLPCVSSQNGKSALVWDLCVICFRGRCHLYDDRHPAALQSGWFVEARDEIRARHKWERLHKIRAYFNSICLHEECFPSAHHILQSRSSCCLRSPFWHSHLRTCDERSRDWGEA